MIFKAKNTKYKDTNRYDYIAPRLLRLDVFFAFIIVGICIALFVSKFHDFSDNAKPNIQKYHKKVFERSMSAYKAQLSIPNNYKDFSLIENSEIIKEAIALPSLHGCKKLWDIVFSLGENSINYNNKILQSSDVSIEVITDKTCRYFLKNNNERQYYFDYALNM